MNYIGHHQTVSDSIMSLPLLSFFQILSQSSGASTEDVFRSVESRCTRVNMSVAVM